MENNNNNQQQNNISKEEIQDLLNQQTVVILNAVDEKIAKLDERVARLELSINQKFDKLTNTLDAFLKRMTDMEDEFEIMKYEINKMKGILREKLQVEI